MSNEVKCQTHIVVHNVNNVHNVVVHRSIIQKKVSEDVQLVLDISTLCSVTEIKVKLCVDFLNPWKLKNAVVVILRHQQSLQYMCNAINNLYKCISNSSVCYHQHIIHPK